MAAAGARARDGTPPPIIAKAGRYTVFLTPPATGTPKGPNAPVVTSATKFKSPVSPAPNHASFVTKPKPSSSPKLNQGTSISAPASTKPAPAPPSKPTVPVQVPPLQFDSKTKDRGKAPVKGGAFGFFWNAVGRVQDAHASLDEHLAQWFGLNQSRYQWALNDYYGSKGLEMGSGKLKGHASEGQHI